MARLLITSGPTREYLDPVRFLSNASSGRMGAALAEAALASGYEVTLVSGPVALTYPPGAEVIPVETTAEMLSACEGVFSRCVGLIAAAAPCDYRPRVVSATKLGKTGQPRTLELVETPDILAALTAQRTTQWIVGFALETHDHRARALAKLRRKGCDWIVLNTTSALTSSHTHVHVLAGDGQVLAELQGAKTAVAARLIALCRERLG